MRCTQCHSTSGWKVTKSTLVSRFDHSRTRYPLTGKHAPVECGSCHKTSNFSAPIASSRCIDCHKDEHNGQFAGRTDRGDCASCHTVAGFESSSFDVKAHTSTNYPLDGKHSAVACARCHSKKGRFTDYHPPSGACTDCHKDAHAGQFSARFADKCESCHSVHGFAPSTFGQARHRQARFDLAGAHAAVACTDCHTADSRLQTHRYLFEERSCKACHQDPHELPAKQAACEGCHTLNAWAPTRGFDHGTTRFPLLGRHRLPECLSCHQPQTLNGARHIRFSGAQQQCAGCHEDIHAGQFADRPGAADCGSCHTAANWKPTAGFDHALTAFPLDGAHRNVRCVLCHEKTSQVNGRQTLLYREAPTECASCH
jgi:hypothetical protein